MNPTTIVLDRHEETHLGLHYPVILHNIAEQATVDGVVVGIAVPNSEYIAQLVAASLCFLPCRLTAQEYRFLRRVIGMSVETLAARLAIQPDLLRDLERFDGVDILAGFDTYIRLAVGALLQKTLPQLPPLHKIFMQGTPDCSNSQAVRPYPIIEIHLLQHVMVSSPTTVMLQDYEIHQVTCCYNDVVPTVIHRRPTERTDC